MTAQMKRLEKVPAKDGLPRIRWIAGVIVLILAIAYGARSMEQRLPGVISLDAWTAASELETRFRAAQFGDERFNRH